MRPLPNIDLRPWFLLLTDLPEPPLDLAALFENSNPVELEVGSGRGLFLQTAAESHPDRNFLGIEYDMKEARRAALRLHKRKLPNTRLMGCDATVFIPKYIPTASIEALHVYFPDPWWKRRHHKRRMFNPVFVDQAARIIKPGGLLHSWTDVEGLFEEILGNVRACPAFELLLPPAERPAAHDMDYHTSFERKKRQLGLPIYRACWRRSDAAHVPGRTLPEV